MKVGSEKTGEEKRTENFCIKRCRMYTTVQDLEGILPVGDKSRSRDVPKPFIIID